jgi:hypothetical protein
MQHNPKDPMLTSGPEAERKLFEQLGRVCNDFPREVVAGAASNLIINAIRQNFATRETAEKAFDELFGRTKSLLLDQHYDSVTGKRRNIFPFTQHIEIPLTIDKDGF